MFIALLLTVLAQPPQEAHESVERSLRYLEQGALAWKADHNCASCHHAPMMLWACNEAKKRGYTVDEAVVETVRTWINAPSPENKLLPDKNGRPDFDNFSLGAALTVVALCSGPQETLDVAGLERIQHNWVEKQQPDGSYLINGTFPGRSPILEAGGVATCIARLAMDALPARIAEVDEASKRAEAWLSKPAESIPTQELALRVLLAARHAMKVDVAPLAMELLSLQRPEGGWSQAPDLPPDAYATGQALYALGAAGLRATAPPIADAVAYLVRTQRDKGDWPMESRPMPPTNKGATNLEPITFAATAWATLGLLAVH